MQHSIKPKIDWRKKMLYKQLSYEERAQTGILLKEKYSIRKIAKAINRVPGTISRKIKRNNWDAFRAEYNANFADRKYHMRKKIPVQQPKLQDVKAKNYVIENLKSGWSPEQTAGTINMEISKTASHETIYKSAVPVPRLSYLSLEFY